MMSNNFNQSIKHEVLRKIFSYCDIVLLVMFNLGERSFYVLSFCIVCEKSVILILFNVC